MRKSSEIIAQWASWGRQVAPVPYRVNWGAVENLMQAASPILKENSKALREFLDRSRNEFGFADPLLCDLGVHRWLSSENSYSDWLAWVLEQLRNGPAVLRILSIPSSESDLEPYTVEREYALAEGNEDSTGRIDLLIRFPTRMIGVEVKTEDQQFGKLKGYKASIERLCAASNCVLIAIYDVPEKERHGFGLRKWEEISVALRREVVRFLARGGEQIAGAMMLGFVAAVEQNLLDVSAASARRAHRGKPTLLSSRLDDYVRRLGGEGDDRGAKRAAY